MSDSSTSGDDLAVNRKRTLTRVDPPISKRPKQSPKSANEATSLLISSINSLVGSPDLNDSFSCVSRPLIFADFGALESFPYQPLITISGFGVLPLPVTKLTFQELVKHFNFDQVSNSISIVMSNVSFGETSFENLVKDLEQKYIFPKVGCFSFLQRSCALSKLTIQGPHSGTKVHRVLYSDDGERDYTGVNGDSYKVGTLYVQLPSIYTGGKVKVEHEAEKCALSFDPSPHQQECYYYSCIGPVKVSQAPIISGYNAILEYSLFAMGGIDERLHPTVQLKISIGNYLKYLADRDRPVFLTLQGNCKGKVCDIWKFSHPNDKKLVDSILEGTLYADCSQIEIYLASLRKTTIEQGDCLDNAQLRCCEWMNKEVPTKKNCFKVNPDLSVKTSYKVHDFKSMSEHTPDAKLLSIENINIEYVEKFALVENWGPVVNVGCSGMRPENYPIVEYESYRQKDVIMILSTTKSFHLKLEHSIECAIEFLEGVDLSLIKENQLREMEKSVIVKLRNKLSRSSCQIKYRMISVCIRNKSWLSCLDMLRICSRKKNAGIPIKEDMKFAYKTIAKVVDTFGWELAEKPIMLLFKKCLAYQSKEVIKCVNLIPQADKSAVFDYLIKKITVDSDHFKNFDWFFHFIFQFGVSSVQNVPESVWENLSECENFLTRRNLICCLRRYGSKVCDKILSICYDEIDMDCCDTWTSSFDGGNGEVNLDCDGRGCPFEDEESDLGFANKVLRFCIENEKADMISRFANGAKKYWDYVEECCLLVDFVIRVFTDLFDIEKLDPSLLALLQRRLSVLKPSVDGGEPPFTWSQPQVRQHKDDIYGFAKFLHGPEQVSTFFVRSTADFLKRFGDVSWQTERTGYYSVEARGLTIEVTKKKTAWKRNVRVYRNKVAEYERIVQFVEYKRVVFT